MNETPPDWAFRIALDAPNETLDIEFKQHLELRDEPGQSKLAKQICALCNHGGGWIVFGRTDDGGCLGERPPEFDSVNNDSINWIADTYLEPVPNCELRWVSSRKFKRNFKFPVIHVPSYGEFLVSTKRDGYDFTKEALKSEQHNSKLDKKKVLRGKANNSTNLKQILHKNTVYVRLPNPKSAPLFQIKSSAVQFHEFFKKSVDKHVWEKLAAFESLNAKVIADKTSNDSVQDYANLKTTDPLGHHMGSGSVQLSSGTFIEQSLIEWEKHKYSRNLALISLLGSWNEQNGSDLKVLFHLLGHNNGEIKEIANEIQKLPNSPLSVENSKWTVSDRTKVLKHLGSKISDSDIKKFERIAITVLSESNPRFDNSFDHEVQSSHANNRIRFSVGLRQGISECLALLANEASNYLNSSNCTVSTLGATVVQKVLNGDDWRIWMTLGDSLSTLAESAPNELLNQVKCLLESDSHQIDEISDEENPAYSHEWSLIQLLKALEVLTWNDNYIVEACTVIAELANRTSDDEWSERLENSLIGVFSLQYPQTLASIQIQMSAIQSIFKHAPDIGWNVLLKTLYGKHAYFSSGSNKPKPVWYQKITDYWYRRYNEEELSNLNNFYSDLAVKKAGTSFKRIAELTDQLEFLSDTALDELVLNLKSPKIKGLSDRNKKMLWENLKVSIRNEIQNFEREKITEKRFNKLKKFREVVDSLKSDDPFYRYLHLFSKYQSRLPEDYNDKEKSGDLWKMMRQDAIKFIMKEFGLVGVLEFVKFVPCPLYVGIALAGIADHEIDKELLPSLLLNRNKKIQTFVAYYVDRRLLVKEEKREAYWDWKWADRISNSSWSDKELGKYYSLLPFVEETWNRVRDRLGKNEGMYWKITQTSHFGQVENIDFAVEKLLQYGRPNAALHCILMFDYQRKEFNIDLCIQALLGAFSSKEKFLSASRWESTGLIRYLQSHEGIDFEKIMEVELAYLDVLDGTILKEPKFLDKRLATDPEFFCRLIRTIYQSAEDDLVSEKSADAEILTANSAWNLINYWKTVPGTDSEGNFDSGDFKGWMKRATKFSNFEQLEFALERIGRALINSPKDSDGFWINKTIARTLDKEDWEPLRNGYKIANFNNRSVYNDCLAGLSVSDLVNLFRERADLVKNENHHKFAAILSEVADHYD